MFKPSHILKTTKPSVAATFCLLAFGLGLAAPAPAASEFWAGNGGTTNAPAAGTWTTTTPTVWSDGTVATPDVGWTAGSAAIFGGTDPQTVAITVGGAISASSLTFAKSGYALTNSAAETISTTGNPYVIAAAGTSNTIGNKVTVTTASLSASVGAPGGTAGGTIVVATGGTLTSAKALTISGAGTLVRINGTLSTPNASSAYLAVGGTTGDNATLLVDGGAVAVNRSTGSIWICGGPAAVTGSQGTLTITNGGTVTEVGGFVTIGSSDGDVGTLNLDGGTLTTANINGGGGAALSGTGTSIVNFNGGVLKPQSSPAPTAFLAGITTANVRNGGAVVNNNGFTVIFSQPLLHSSLAGDNAVDGGLTTYGTGILTLTGANTYNGPTIVSSGGLVITSDSTGGGAYAVANGASLEVQVNTPGTSLAASTLTLGTTGGATNTFTLNGNASPTLPAVTVHGQVTLNGPVTVNVNGSVSGPSTNLLMSYGSLSGAGAFVAGSLPAVSGYAALLVNDPVKKQLSLVYLPPSVPVQWAVTSGNWDTTSINWEPLGGGAMTHYYELSPVTFDDTAPFAATHTVTLTGDHNPTDITVNSDNNYVFTGGYAIASGGTLTKSGTGTLVLGVNCAYSGGTVINSGIVQVGAGGAAGSLGSGAVTDNSAIVFDRSDAFPVPNSISGSGGVTNDGPGMILLTATNEYSGATVVDSGGLSVLSANNGDGDYIVASNGTLNVVAVNSGSYLQINNLTYQTAGSVTNSFNLGANRSGNIPLVYSVGALSLNGTVTVNVTGTGLSAGAYVLLQYSGTPSGNGNFVAGSLPGVSSITNDTSLQQLKLIVGTPGLVWDSGNTNDGGTIEPADGTWDLSLTNLVWNNAGVNVPFPNGNNAIFAGADGAYTVKVGAAISAPIITFLNSGYNLVADTNQVISLGTTSTSVPKLVVAGGKTAVIGSNVTVNASSTSFFGFADATNPGGTLIIASGGVFQETTGNTWALEGAGTEVSVQTGGLLKHAGGGSGQLAIGAGNLGNPSTLSVDGGSVQISANNCAFNIGTGAAGSPVAGVLTLNSGTVSMPAGATVPLSFGIEAGNIGTLNLNGGTLSVARIVQGDPGALVTNNFNGGTLKAVNATFGSSFLNGLDAANIRNGGLVFDDGGFAITIGQQLQHSPIAGDNAVDGGLTKTGAGTLTLTAANTYTGPTMVTNGTLWINGSVSGDAAAAVAGILGGNGTIGGSVTISAGGTLVPGTTTTDTLTISGNLSLQGNAQFVVNESITPSNSFCVVGGSVSSSGSGMLTVTNLGPVPQAGDSFKLFSQPVANGGGLQIVPPPGPGLAWSNSLAFNGSIGVVVASSIASYPTNITLTVTGNTLALSWPATHLGWIAQSNSVSLTDPNSWFDIPNSDSGTNLNVTVSSTLTNVFYRLRHP